MLEAFIDLVLILVLLGGWSFLAYRWWRRWLTFRFVEDEISGDLGSLPSASTVDFFRQNSRLLAWTGLGLVLTAALWVHQCRHRQADLDSDVPVYGTPPVDAGSSIDTGRDVGVSDTSSTGPGLKPDEIEVDLGLGTIRQETKKSLDEIRSRTIDNLEAPSPYDSTEDSTP